MEQCENSNTDFVESHNLNLIVDAILGHQNNGPKIEQMCLLFGKHVHTRLPQNMLASA